ncbi:NADH:flavin oxidoreductase/NADH oxidase [Haloferax mediterranei ATCC 33500]|uniref:NADH-dependent flavin oxidoreductase n=1 Tax=Haloferax mediterranei (strain ATCC 33500 / DSM 1411 / JCM 8866 / NBRC 14739 / NCIMB 2177 / R-4) TaxID=523841 RepID=I3R3C8_HALMT|nr:NADH:flavin oxidoreductase/NADH oxidase [Haloferax mediterranei]AFK18738.1 NADH-dependent flavin oxidoreductase [Haloferax mediterranei ATCC 33500]AHZ21895.1 NADH:flavin oxidoreductase / NADH oxidase [Haloferax mediterranei ATCC 33500]EMA03403.1 NADH-dependent flavin oxidoreductase [Haloferax mediterranei ATCC 33500]MDX5988833.1 NADH:flavin oxidoreductase/NADH oxidase [Haloferax mediterranei ATCC 33500]QCQ75235.1 NADH:flavin oxidoreductase/NADH oxidase [Haloferax mediterranei ATCC 33500]
MTDTLFSPLSFRETEVPNRVMVSPMCQYSSTDGFANDWHLVHLGSRAVGGAGIVMTEATAVSPEGRISPHDLGIWSDEHVESLERISSFVESMGSVPAIQLAHAGRKASKSRPWDGSDPICPEDGGWTTVAPSDVPWPYEGEPPELHELTTQEIAGIVDDFRAAAVRALDAGFEIAEVHAAHGYLLHEFLSPVTNRREDAYGGSFENRTRLVREVTETVRGVWPDDKPVFVRISATDWLDDRDSWDLEQSVRLADDLDDLGVDLVDVSAGGTHPDQQIPNTGPGYQVPYAEVISDETDVRVGAVGGIRTARHADEVVSNGRADLAIVGREHLRDPYFALHAAEDLNADTEWPPQYRRAVPRR